MKYEVRIAGERVKSIWALLDEEMVTPVFSTPGEARKIAGDFNRAAGKPLATVHEISDGEAESPTWS